MGRRGAARRGLPDLARRPGARQRRRARGRPRLKVFLTGATGFVMGAVARRLRARGDDVVALVRSRSRAGELERLGCLLAEGDLADEPRLREAMAGCDAAIHGAAIYEIGISKARRAEMFETNVRGTERVLAAARAARLGRVVFVSTVAAFGNTRGRVVDETYRHDGHYTSAYDETKHRAHEIAVRYASLGLPVVIVQPGQVYGPRDHSGMGGVMARASRGRLPAIVFPDLGLGYVHVDDVAEGIVLALDRGRAGESYVLGGEVTTVRGMLATLARVTGRPAPRIAVPTALVRLAALALPRLREVVTSCDGVTFWAKDDKARAELGYAPRSLERGLRETFSR